MGDIERIQRIAAPMPVDPARVHKADESRDGRQQRPHQEPDVIELTSVAAEEVVPTPVPTEFDDEGHFDIAV